MQRTKVVCETCGREISKSNYKKHNLVCTGVVDSRYHINHEGLNCIYCNKLCKSKKSLSQHEIRCKDNPQRIDVVNNNFNSKGRTPWNKGLTKHTDERLRLFGENLSARYASGELIPVFKGKKHTEEYKQHLRQVALSRELGGFNMRRGVLYNGVKLDSSFEVIVAKSLDRNNIKWERPPRFEYYTEDGKLHNYTPDFYLPEFDVYLDPKNDFLLHNVNPKLGYKDTDKIKLVEKQNGIRVIILDKDNLQWDCIHKKICRISSAVE